MLLIYRSLTNCCLDMQYNSHMNMLSIFHAISITFLLLLNKEQPTTPHTIPWKSSVRDLNKARKGTHSTEELLQTSHSPQKFSWLSVIPFFRLFPIAKRGVHHSCTTPTVSQTCPDISSATSNTTKTSLTQDAFYCFPSIS